MNFFEGDLSQVPTILPDEVDRIPTPDEESSKEGLYWTQLQQQVANGWLDPQVAEGLLTDWHNRRIEAFGNSILLAS